MPNSIANIWDGGAAWDAATNSMWVSSAGVLSRFDIACTSTCAPNPEPIGPGALVTGLDVVDSLNELWIIDTAGVITRCNGAICPHDYNSAGQSIATTPPANPTFAGTDMSPQCIGDCNSTTTTSSNCLTRTLQGV